MKVHEDIYVAYTIYRLWQSCLMTPWFSILSENLITYHCWESWLHLTSSQLP